LASIFLRTCEKFSGDPSARRLKKRHFERAGLALSAVAKRRKAARKRFGGGTKKCSDQISGKKFSPQIFAAVFYRFAPLRAGAARELSTCNDPAASSPTAPSLSFSCPWILKNSFNHFAFPKKN
jgi:hypothetical protein